MIKLAITKSQENPKFDEEYKEYKEANKYSGFRSGDVSFPQKYFQVAVLEVEITDEQFEAIRKAVLDKF